MKILVTGSDGFIAQNLISHLGRRKDAEVLSFSKKTPEADLLKMLDEADFIYHLAGVNRPKDAGEFYTGNASLTQKICDYLIEKKKKTSIVYSSSIQAQLDNDYGKSKKQAEDALLSYQDKTDGKAYIYRFPNVFGKWSKPNYNSVVSTFCYNVANGIALRVDGEGTPLKLAYVDDIVEDIILHLDNSEMKSGVLAYTRFYETTLGELSHQIQSFRNSRETLITDSVGEGLVRALYATYLTYLPKESFLYDLTIHEDPRGRFVEMLKTKDSGQFSFFTAHPGVTRGGHYHHTKTEKFLIVQGKALFKFKHITTGEYFELITTSEKAQIVETIPGWAHDITNIGDNEMVVLLWANEIFDRNKPDTYAAKVQED